MVFIYANIKTKGNIFLLQGEFSNNKIKNPEASNQLVLKNTLSIYKDGEEFLERLCENFWGTHRHPASGPPKGDGQCCLRPRRGRVYWPSEAGCPGGSKMKHGAKGIPLHPC